MIKFSKRIKRICSVFLSMIMLLSTLNTVVIAEGEESNNGVLVEGVLKDDFDNKKNFIRVGVYWAPRTDGSKAITDINSDTLDWNRKQGNDRQAVFLGVADVVGENFGKDENGKDILQGKLYSSLGEKFESGTAYYYETMAFRETVYTENSDIKYKWENVGMLDKLADYKKNVLVRYEHDINALNVEEAILCAAVTQVNRYVQKTYNKRDESAVASSCINTDLFKQGVIKGVNEDNAIWTIQGGYMLTVELGEYYTGVPEFGDIDVSPWYKTINESNTAALTRYDMEAITCTNGREATAESGRATNTYYDWATTNIGELGNRYEFNFSGERRYTPSIEIFGEPKNKYNDYFNIGSLRLKNAVGIRVYCYMGAIQEEAPTGNIEGVPVIKYYYDASAGGVSMAGPNDLFNGSAEYIRADRYYSLDDTGKPVYKASETDWIPDKNNPEVANPYDLRGFVILNTYPDKDASGSGIGHKLLYDTKNDDAGKNDVDVKDRVAFRGDNGTEIIVNRKNRAVNKGKIPFVGNIVDSEGNIHLPMIPENNIQAQSASDSWSVQSIATIASLGMTEGECLSSFNVPLSSYDDNEVGEIFNLEDYTYKPPIDSNNVNNTQLVLLYVKGICDIPRIENEAWNWIYIHELYYDYEDKNYRDTYIGINGEPETWYRCKAISDEKEMKRISDLQLYKLNKKKTIKVPKNVIVETDDENDTLENNDVEEEEIEQTFNFEEIIAIDEDDVLNPRGPTVVYDWRELVKLYANINNIKYHYSAEELFNAIDSGTEVGDTVEIESDSTLDIEPSNFKTGQGKYREVYVRYGYGNKPESEKNILDVLKPEISEKNGVIELGQKHITKAIDFNMDLEIRPEVKFYKSPDNGYHTYRTNKHTRTHKYNVWNVGDSGKQFFNDYVSNTKANLKKLGDLSELSPKELDATEAYWDKRDNRVELVVENQIRNDNGKLDNYSGDYESFRYTDTDTFKNELEHYIGTADMNENSHVWFRGATLRNRKEVIVKGNAPNYYTVTPNMVRVYNKFLGSASSAGAKSYDNGVEVPGSNTYKRPLATYAYNINTKDKTISGIPYDIEWLLDRRNYNSLNSRYNVENRTPWSELSEVDRNYTQFQTSEGRLVSEIAYIEDRGYYGQNEKGFEGYEYAIPINGGGTSIYLWNKTSVDDHNNYPFGGRYNGTENRDFNLDPYWGSQCTADYEYTIGCLKSSHCSYDNGYAEPIYKQTKYIEDAGGFASRIQIKNYSYYGNKNIGSEAAQMDVDPSFTIGDREFTGVNGYRIRGNDDTAYVGFFPYVEMLYDTAVWVDNDGNLPVKFRDTNGDGKYTIQDEIPKYLDREDGFVAVERDNPAFILAGHQSKFIPNDYLEIGYSTVGDPGSSYSSSTGLLVESQQWSGHKSALDMVSNNETLKAYKDRAVLPGGAIYRLRTVSKEFDTDPNYKRTQVGVKNYITVVPADVSESGAIAYGGGLFSIDKQVNRLFAFLNQVKGSLNNLNIVQVIVNGPNSETVVEPGKAIVNGQIASTDSKYQLNIGDGDGSVTTTIHSDGKDIVVGADGNNVLNGADASRADLDITGEKYYVDCYRIASDIDGNVVVTKASDEYDRAGDMFADSDGDAINNISELTLLTKPKRWEHNHNDSVKYAMASEDKYAIDEGGKLELFCTDPNCTKNGLLLNGQEHQIAWIGKTEGIKELLGSNAELIDVDAKTKLFTNYLNSIDRNKGWDPTGEGDPENGPYALGANSSPAWYNEAFDGLCVLVVRSAIEVGFKGDDSIANLNEVVRMSVLDPNLQPQRTSQSDLFSQYVTSCFRTETKTRKLEESADYFVDFSGSDGYINKVLVPHFGHAVNNPDGTVSVTVEDGYIGSYSKPCIDKSSLGPNDIIEVKLDLSKLYRSKDFAIPNVSVMDLY